MFGKKRNEKSSSYGGQQHAVSAGALGVDPGAINLRLNELYQEQKSLKARLEGLEMRLRLIETKTPEPATEAGTAETQAADRLHVDAGPLVVSDPAASPDIERDVRSFLMLCDEGRIALAEAAQWFRGKSESYGVEAVCMHGDSWGLLRVFLGNEARVLPVLRTPMLRLPVDGFYETRGYNNIEPLKYENVTRMAIEHWHDGVWRVTLRGEIDGLA